MNAMYSTNNATVLFTIISSYYRPSLLIGRYAYPAVVLVMILRGPLLNNHVKAAVYPPTSQQTRCMVSNEGIQAFIALILAVLVKFFFPNICQGNNDSPWPISKKVFPLSIGEDDSHRGALSFKVPKVAPHIQAI